MILKDLHIHNVRNLQELKLHLAPRFNLITAANGRGKTSILEALYLLSRGHSFKTREITPLISHGQKNLTVFARSVDNQTISIQKSTSSPTLVKLNDQLCNNSSQLAYALPCQVFYQDFFEIIDSGASLRRAMLDWGMFHVKHSYLSLWKDYKRVLQQRQALLKQQASIQALEPWNLQLVELAKTIDTQRAEYFLHWKSAFEHLLKQLTDTPCSLSYYKGWDRRNTGKDLLAVLKEQYSSDLQKQYTQYGAHQADILIETEDHSAKKTLSRGQQKMILVALKLAQTDLLEQNCLYLFDDYAAELDKMHQQRLLDVLSKRNGQYVLTSTEDLFAGHFKDDYQIIEL